MQLPTSDLVYSSFTSADTSKNFSLKIIPVFHCLVTGSVAALTLTQRPSLPDMWLCNLDFLPCALSREHALHYRNTSTSTLSPELFISDVIVSKNISLPCVTSFIGSSVHMNRYPKRCTKVWRRNMDCCPWVERLGFTTGNYSLQLSVEAIQGLKTKISRGAP